ncbi:PE domain-containing protein [Nocardia sp. NRRL S-836]|uniref:PE domain-containing protein n=1 Tax=Nocardia sp. NRRL S-836 TaxID=1519492 RepID=UPI0006AF04CA|nr:PE domain-containing protein [Nocardia sp. NRRL S-836]KOV82701.1 hypothetical protein ADL03_23295 [Nocardia sp. NRRL S-836]
MSGTKIDLETLRAAIKDYEKVVQDLVAAHSSGVELTMVRPPGKDVPGQVYSGSATIVGEMHQQANTQLQEVLKTRIENLKATLRQYESTEQDNEATFRP